MSEPLKLGTRGSRLALAQAELDAAGEFDVVVVNDDVARAADELVRLLTAPSSPCLSQGTGAPTTD